MTNDALKALWSHRLSLVERFTAKPEDYKECDQCRSISIKRAAICHICGAYRFIENPERVRATASEMGTSPYPFSAPIVPRIEFVSNGLSPVSLTGSTRIEFETAQQWETDNENAQDRRKPCER